MIYLEGFSLKIVIMLFLTIIIYLVFPILYVKKYGKTSEKAGKKIALLNSIICAGIFFVLGLLMNVPISTNGTMFAPAFFYYYISKSILVDKYLPNRNEPKVVEKINIEEPESDDCLEADSKQNEKNCENKDCVENSCKEDGQEPKNCSEPNENINQN